MRAKAKCVHEISFREGIFVYQTLLNVLFPLCDLTNFTINACMIKFLIPKLQHNYFEYLQLLLKAWVPIFTILTVRYAVKMDWHEGFVVFMRPELLKRVLILFSSSHRRCFIKTVVLKHFGIFTGKHPCWSPFLTKLHPKLLYCCS